jgi:hypothetical protein
MEDSRAATVRVFGSLRDFQHQRNLPAETLEEIPLGGISASELAESMELPVDSIEGVFCNHTIYSLAHIIMPADQVAFVPYGTPGPHRYYLGLYRAGREERD